MNRHTSPDSPVNAGFAVRSGDERPVPFTILSRHATIGVPCGTFRRRAPMTNETIPLEPGVEDRTWSVG